MWREETIGIPEKGGKCKSVKYWAKYFERPSEDYDINGGKISKSSLKMNSEWVAGCDKGWDIKPACEEASVTLNILLNELN